MSIHIRIRIRTGSNKIGSGFRSFQNLLNFLEIKALTMVKMLFLILRFYFQLILRSIYMYSEKKLNFEAWKIKFYLIEFVFGSSWLRIRIWTNYSDPDLDPDSDPAKRFGSFRIRIRLRIQIHNTDPILSYPILLYPILSYCILLCIQVQGTGI